MRDLDKFLGCLIGGAAGDALGYEVEFMGAEDIFRRFGPRGIREFVCHDGEAKISDDTQMTLFTATGLLFATTRGMLRGILGPYRDYIGDSYRDWLRTQDGAYSEARTGDCSWLANVQRLYSRRAPGMTCLRALRSGYFGTPEEPINKSKGCGGVMRVAPVGLYFVDRRIKESQVAVIAAETAALTHGHELGWLSAAVLACVVYEVAGSDRPQLVQTVRNAVQVVKEAYPWAEEMKNLESLLEKALALAAGKSNDVEAIRQLGEGWVGDEALAIAVYCAVKYGEDFEQALIAAVNHGGDSDSTGAITGNILGAWLGYKEIPKKYVKDLELLHVIVEVAYDLYNDCRMEEYGSYRDQEWLDKYVYVTYPR